MARSYFLPRYWPKRLIWWVEYAFIATLINTLRCLPLRVSARVAGGLFAFVGPFSARAAKVRKNFMVVAPQASSAELDRLMRASFRHLGVAVAELVSLARIWRDRDKRIEFTLAPGAVTPSPERRTVFVTAHLSAWQLTPLVGPYYGVTVPVIYAPEDNPYVDRKFASLRRAFGGPLVSRDGGIKALMRALDKGQSIGLTADTRMDAGDMLPFFGEDAPTNTAPARLALRYECDMVPVRAERLPGARYRITVYPPIRPRDSDASRAAQARDMIVQLAGHFERWISATPGQWLCLKRRWPKDVYKRLSAYRDECFGHD
ncbi:Lipid A biosynthesis acyltransferase [Salinisphaera sp. T5B8]|uniref:lysophospholipid acyltransferase family protein n=1 Tax=Salinisphaera sp. T5B8 TaxID=1304154 RepID=UPI003340799D